MEKKLSADTLNLLKHQALNIRIDSIRATTASKSGHPTSCLSAADIISVLFFHTLKHDLKNPKASNNDRFILSKGHAIPMVYAAYKHLGVISDEELMSLRKFDSVLEGHPTPRFVHNEAATGSLGQGLAVAAGMALSAKHEKLNCRTYVMMGDAEIAEGSIWEAAELISHNKLDSVVGIVDANRLGQSQAVMHDHEVEKYARKFEAFGWQAFVIDGHNVEEIVETFEKTKTIKDKPCVLIAKTFKGYGLDDRENKNNYHGKPIKDDELEETLAHLKNRFSDAARYKPASPYIPILPEGNNEKPEKHRPISIDIASDINTSVFDQNQKIATRKAYGYALAALGRANKEIFALDGDVKNSTFSEIFEQEFPERFVECFVAEQNMIGVSTGLQARGKIPFAATFAAFFTRAHDQIRMASIGRNALRLCGSHAGVSIGEDGPSQMGLEDLCMMRAIPDSIVLYPSDGVSTYKLTELMANYHEGVSYMRTTRSTTPMLYDKDEHFEVGGCKVLRQSKDDKLCLVGAGITLHNALQAYELLKDQGIAVSVIDLYSIKPLDTKTLKTVANASNNTILTVEDHYLEGGIGEAIARAVINDGIRVKNLYVSSLSRSGTPDELMQYAGIDAQSIVDQVLLMI